MSEEVILKTLVSSLKAQIPFNHIYHKSGLGYEWSATAPRAKMMLGASLEDYFKEFTFILKIHSLVVCGDEVYDQNGLPVSQIQLLKDCNSWLNNHYGKDEY